MATVRQPAFGRPSRRSRSRSSTAPTAASPNDRATRARSAPRPTTTSVLTDRAVSRYHVDVVRRADGIGIVDQQSTNGTWLGALRLERAVLPLAPSSASATRSSARRRASRTIITIPRRSRRHGGRVAAMPALCPDQSAARRASVLVLGESGTGKELVARSIHGSVPCGGAPSSPSTAARSRQHSSPAGLFGHERGAFTGASHQRRRARGAHGGTIFFDGIGELRCRSVLAPRRAAAPLPGASAGARRSVDVPRRQRYHRDRCALR